MVARVIAIQISNGPLDSWHKEVEELRHRKELAKRLGGDEGLRRQREAGKLTVRERITQLLDPNSFVEVGSIAGKATYSEHDYSITSFLPANFVSGTFFHEIDPSNLVKINELN